jgi:CRISPR/Cas system-associated exonuclease Cas4 (RecB family)
LVRRTLKLSMSTISLFQSCPAQYYFIKILGFLPYDNIYARKGKIMHSLIEWYEQNGKPSDWEMQLGMLFDFRPLRISNELLTQFFNDCISMMRDYIYSKYSDDYSILYSELRILDDELQFEGVIDSVRSDVYGKVNLIDYKTGKFLLGNHDTQLKFYAMLYYRKYGILPQKGVIWFLKNSFIEEVDYEMQDVINAEKYIRETREQIRNSNFEPNVTKNCFFCGFKNLCGVNDGNGQAGIKRTKVDEFTTKEG